MIYKPHCEGCGLQFRNDQDTRIWCDGHAGERYCEPCGRRILWGNGRLSVNLETSTPALPMPKRLREIGRVRLPEKLVG